MSLARKRLKRARRLNSEMRVRAINEALTIDQCREIVRFEWTRRSEKQIERGAQVLFEFCQSWAARHYTHYDLAKL